MIRKLQFLLMFLCLGLFVFPKQTLVIENANISCCSSKQETSSDCCKHKESKKAKSCHQDSKKETDCKDNCTSCKTCHTGFVFSVILNNSEDIIDYSFNENKHPFSLYKENPTLRYFNIWQPPKLG